MRRHSWSGVIYLSASLVLGSLAVSIAAGELPLPVWIAALVPVMGALLTYWARVTQDLAQSEGEDVVKPGPQP